MAVCIRLQIERKKFPACRQAGNLLQDSDKKLFVDEYNSGMRRVISTSIRDKQIGALAEWIYMRRSEIPEIVVQFHGAPHMGLL